MTPRPLACALVLTLIAGLAAPEADAAKKRAPAKAKTPAAANACTDFYASANGDWLRANTLSPGAASVSALGQLSERARSQQIELLHNSMNSPQNDVQKLLNDF